MDVDKKEIDLTWKKGKLGVRHRQAIIIFLCVTVCYIVRTTVSVAVIAMTEKSNTYPEIPTFDWNKKIQNYIMGSFNWGNILIQIPVSHLMYRYGAKWFLGTALVVNGILSYAIPYAALYGGWKLVCACRSLQGFTQGCLIPSIHTLVGRWAPFAERNRMGNFIYAGTTLGTIIAMPLSGYLSSTSYGWPSVFKVVAVLNLSVGALWLIFGANSPSQHETISSKERNYIESSLGQFEEEKFSKAPWRKIFSSKAYLSTVFAHIGGVYGFTTMFFELPAFLKASLGVNVSETGFLSTIPYITSLITLLASSTLADYLINSNKTNVTTLRKVANTIGTWGPGAMMFTLMFIPQNQYLIMFITILVVCLDDINSLGFFINYVDLSPKYAGMMGSIGNCLSETVANASPIITGLILKDPSDVKQWRYVFLVPTLVYFVTNIVFLIFGTGEKQNWEEDDEVASKENVNEDLLEKKN